MRLPSRYLVTSALPYANGPLHVGHLTGAYLPADAYVRMLRLMGIDVVYVCGSDEHGAAITIRAKKENTTPKEIIDRYHDMIKTAFEGMQISFDIYHRTSAEIHHRTSQDFFEQLYANGQFDEIESEQYYDEEAAQFLADRYIKGICPKCAYEEAYGDQCENCGSTLSPTELLQPKSTLSGSVPVLRKTKHWYLPLQKQEDWLRDYIEKGQIEGQSHHDPDLWKNHVLGQCKSWIDGGLQPRAMTRDLDWGVDVPQHIEGAQGKKLYVWLDAPIGYISATKQWAEDLKKDWTKYWKSDDCHIVHFIGKDNIVFHCLIFPTILKLHGEYNLPINVPANQFINLEGRKVSTSRGWAVWIHEYLQDLPGKEDELRYYLFKVMPEQRDSEFTWKGFQEAVNNELVNNLANFVNRVVVLVNKYYEGIIPEVDETVGFESGAESDMPTWLDIELLGLFDEMHEVRNATMKFDFRGAIKKMMEISSYGNGLLQVNEPWKKVKDDPEQVKVVLFLGLHYVAALSLICAPFLPKTADKMQRLLGLPKVNYKGDLAGLLNELAEGNYLFQPGHRIQKSDHLFTKISDEVIQAQIDKLYETNIQSEEEFQEVKPNISFDEFSALDLRTATILSAEKIKKTKKLLKLEIDIGFETRTVVSGIAEHHDPETLIGKKIVVVANLAPRKIKGVESQGMILMAENGEGTLGLVGPPGDWANGYAVK